MNNLRLTSLELNGYKTFASSTRFEFAGPVTAVVGPNGSGKSNIADALRWVLGEQSYSLLRGRKTEDMIFSGSEKRPRAGMASATVTFDNSEGWLPIDFSEVSITRRAYRDGQNEYLINQQKVRLRDVNELLSQSALAERTYTVIGQGLVDTALTLSSDERRKLFEEAAGIGLYRNRKEQAERRLDATRRNLERVADIMAELKPRLRSLERQAQRATEYATLRADLRESLRAWYGFQWHHAQRGLKAVREEAIAREENLGLARQNQRELNNELAQLRNQAQELRVELNNWHRRLSELHAGRESSSRELAVANERQRALAERRLALGEERQRLEAELGGLRVRLETVEAEKKRLEAETADSQSRLSEAQKTLAEHIQMQQDSEAQNRAVRDQLAETQGQLVTLEAQRNETLARQGRDQNELIELEKMLADIAEQIKIADQDGVAQNTDVAEREEALAKFNRDLEKQESRVSEMLATRQEMETKYAELLSRQARLAAEIKGLEEADVAAAGFADGAKRLLEAARAKRLKLAPGTLGRELTVPAKLEAAIAAALGAYMDAVLVQAGGSPDQVLEVLEQDDSSAAVLPLAGLSPSQALASQNGKGVLGVAAELVQAPAELAQAVELLLGQVLVVEDRRVAQRVIVDLPAQARVVTLRGELFHRGGQFEVRSSKAAAPLARPRQARELREQLSKVEQELASFEEKRSALEKELVSSQEKQQALRSQAEAAATEAEVARRAQQSSRLDSEQMLRQLDWFKSQQRNLTRQIEQATEAFEVFDRQEETFGTRIRELQQRIEIQAGATTELPLDEHRAQVAHWEMRLAVSQRALQEVQRRYEEGQAQITQAQEQLAAQEQRRAELEQQEAEIETQKLQFGASEGEVSEELVDIQARISPAEEQLTRTDVQLQSLLPAEAEAQKSLSQAERNHTQAQIALARQQESLATLRQRIEDDFGLVAFEYDDTVSGPTPLPLGDLVEKLPVLEELDPELENTLKEQRAQLRRLGSVNPEAQQEYVSVKDRFEDMQAQVDDLETAERDLKEVITELEVLMDREFRITFDLVAAEFRVIFERLFGGGAARLLLTEEGEMAESGIDIEARLPGKRAQRLALLSGGERSLTAAALVFALLKASPTPFCVMDEVDAMLDEANVGRFTELLDELSKTTQFVLITHNRNTVQVADVIYGITMGRDTASQVISLKLDEVDERYST